MAHLTRNGNQNKMQCSHHFQNRRDKMDYHPSEILQYHLHQDVLIMHLGNLQDIYYLMSLILYKSGGSVNMLTEIRTTTHAKKENMAK